MGTHGSTTGQSNFVQVLRRWSREQGEWHSYTVACHIQIIATGVGALILGLDFSAAHVRLIRLVSELLLLHSMASQATSPTGCHGVNPGINNNKTFLERLIGNCPFSKTACVDFASSVDTVMCCRSLEQIRRLSRVSVVRALRSHVSAWSLPEGATHGVIHLRHLHKCISVVGFSRSSVLTCAKITKIGTLTASDCAHLGACEGLEHMSLHW